MRGRGDAERRGVGERAGERGVALLRRGRWNRPADQVERPILEDADRLTGARVAHDLAARGRCRPPRDARGLHRRRVRERFVPVQPIHEHGIVGRHRVDPLVARQRRPPPQGVIPVAAQDPLAAFAGLREGGDATDELLRGRGVPQVQGRELEPPVGEVGVGVREAG